MALQPVIQILNSADKTKLFTTDITGAYSLANPGGYGSPNTDVSNVGGIYITGSYALNNSAPVNIIPYELLLPTVSYPLPYALNYGFILTPAMLGITSTDFPDGIYTITYNVQTYITVTFTLAGGSPHVAVGDTFFDAVGNEYTVITTNGTGTATLSPKIALNGVLPVDGLFNATPSGATGTIAGSSGSVFSVTQQFDICPNADCCILNALGSIDPYCDNCNKLPMEELWDNFGVLIGSKAAVGCSKNNQALDDLQSVNNWCTKNNCGCGCH